MDDVDLRICQLLISNSRRPQRELADILGINVAAVHRRVEALIEQRIIGGFAANLSVGFLKAIPVQVEGISRCQSIEKVVEQMASIDSVKSVLTAAADLTTISLILRDIAELGPTVERVRKVLQMPEPRVTISMKIFIGNELLDKVYTGNGELSRIDYRIVNSLNLNARKPVVDIAEDTGLTPKTVRLHLEDMERQGAIEYGLAWNPSYSTGSTFILRMDLKPGTDKLRYSSTLNQRFGPRIMMTFVHSNLPDLLCGYCWVPTTQQHRELTEAISKDADVVKVSSGIVHREWGFDTWRTKVLRERASTPRQ
jgi:DNA-binding Lrp family transcriptional regulator